MFLVQKIRIQVLNDWTDMTTDGVNPPASTDRQKWTQNACFLLCFWFSHPPQ